MVAGPTARPDMTIEEIRRNLDYFVANHEVSELVISGGEISGRGDFDELMALIDGQSDSRRFHLVTVISSGFGWTPDQMARACGVIDRFVVSITPGEVKTPFDFLERLVAMGFVVETNTIVLKDNLELLRSTLAHVRALGVRRLSLTFPFPVGRTRASLATLVPSWNEAKPAIIDTVDALRDADVRLVNLPLCYLAEYGRYCRPTSTRLLVEKERQLAQHAVVPPFVGKGHQACCQSCALRADCDGFWPAYLALPDLFPALQPQ